MSAEVIERESMEFDVVVVGAGPSGLSAAIKLLQLAAENDREISVCVVEKGSEVGAHILSGAVLEPRALNELIPDWKEKGAPLNTPAGDDKFMFLTESGSIKLPTPRQMHNHGNYIISLGNFCRWLAEQASRQQKCSTMRMEASRGSQPATWELARTGSPRGTMSRGWNCMPNTPCLQKDAADPCLRI